jgi:hypothetical protein
MQLSLTLQEFSCHLEDVLFSKTDLSQAQWYKTLIPALREWRQESKFKYSLHYISIPCLKKPK